MSSLERTYLTGRDFKLQPSAPLQLVLSTLSFPVNWSAAWEHGESRWAAAGSLSWLGNGPNVPCSAYPASQMDDDEVVMGGGQRRERSASPPFLPPLGDLREEENTLILTSSWGEERGIEGDGGQRWRQMEIMIQCKRGGGRPNLVA